MATTSTNEIPAQHKKRKFVAQAPVPLARPKLCSPKLAALGALPYADESAPPHNVQMQIGDGRLFFAVDVETHMLAPENKVELPNGSGSVSVFKNVQAEDLAHLKLVQIGWAVGDVSLSEPRVRELLVKPCGFEIDCKATVKHGIAQPDASTRGIPLRDVLSEFVKEFRAACQQGARVTSFNLAFDAAVVRHELAREGFADELTEWEQKTGEGLCTMHPDICKWVTSRRGGNEMPRCSLDYATKTLPPEHRSMLQRHHNAGNDAYMHWLLCKALARPAL